MRGASLAPQVAVLPRFGHYCQPREDLGRFKAGREEIADFGPWKGLLPIKGRAKSEYLTIGFPICEFCANEYRAQAFQVAIMRRLEIVEQHRLEQRAREVVP